MIRSSPSWALEFARLFFDWDEQAVQTIVGTPGWRLMLKLWEREKDLFYHLPHFAVRQEWFHTQGAHNRNYAQFFQSIEPNGLLLDWGCGTAESERLDYIEKGRKAILMDLPGPNFEYLKTKYFGFSGIECRPINGNLPKQYDALVCLDVFEHIKNPLPVLNSLWDHLKPGGQALLWFENSYPAPGHLKESVDQVGLYDAWLLKNTSIIKRQRCDWVEKPKRFWRLWN